MVEGAAVFYCEPGDMLTSEVVTQRLRERFGPDRAPPLGDVPRMRVRGWFCPGCGQPLNADLECASCRTHIRDLAYQFVELHPHRHGGAGGSST